MKKLLLMAATVAALALAGNAAAALAPWTFVGAGATCSPTSTFSSGVLHLSKPCTTETNASAGATVTGVSYQTFTSASFTLATPTQCQGGSPRFNVVANGTTFFLGCNNVTVVHRPHLQEPGSVRQLVQPPHTQHHGKGKGH
jgi:hypothetical protein